MKIYIQYKAYKCFNAYQHYKGVVKQAYTMVTHFVVNAYNKAPGRFISNISSSSWLKLNKPNFAL